MLSKDLKEVASSPELIEVARKAIEEQLQEWRDSRLSMMMRGNGLVIKEKDGSASHIIRFGPEQAMTIGLEAIAKHIEASKYCDHCDEHLAESDGTCKYCRPEAQSD